MASEAKIAASATFDPLTQARRDKEALRRFQQIYATSIEPWRHYERWLGELRQLLPDAERTAPQTGSNHSPEATA
jgi:hypothetical protein